MHKSDNNVILFFARYCAFKTFNRFPGSLLHSILGDLEEAHLIQLRQNYFTKKNKHLTDLFLTFLCFFC